MRQSLLCRVLVVPAVLALTAAAGCASLSGAGDDTQLKLDGDDDAAFAVTAHTVASGTADYQSGKTGAKAEWIVCRAKSAAKGTLLVMHEDRAGYDKSKFCGAWIAQALLAKGFNVVTVNRPGYGASTGTPDFSGARSMAALAAGLKTARAETGIAAPTGIWGYSSGAMAAALAARHLGTGSLKFMILGGGVYDLDETLKQTSDSYLRQDIAAIKRTGGDQALEERSVAYDVSGLPKAIVLYHGKLDTVVSPSQAKAYSDSLEGSGEYKVSLQLLDGLGHAIPWQRHRRILEALVAAAGG